MNLLRVIAMAMVCLFLGTTSLVAQCEKWQDSPRKDEAENAHVLYRGIVKGKTVEQLAALPAAEFDLMYSNWKTAFEIAPAADGNRPSHYIDGRNILKALAQRETDAAQKEAHLDMALDLYDQEIACYKNDAFLLGRKAFDMFYLQKYGLRKVTYDALKTALEKGGNNSEYILLEPTAMAIAYLFKSEQLPQAEAQEMYKGLEAIAKHNIENNDRYKQYFEASAARMEAAIKEVEDDLFDCDYFQNKLVPSYKENPEDLEVIKYVYNKLRQEGCDSTQAIMIELKGKYETIAAAMNEQIELERRQNNPGYDAVQLQKEKKYEEAVARYKEAIDQEENADAKAQYYYSVAFIQTWQFGQYQSAKSNAMKAASLKSGWGKPYILIGDIYGKTSRNCGDDWGARLAVLAALDKYSYAKSIDPEVSSDANKRIGNYSASRPEKQEGFMRGVQEGQTVSVPCWIGEKVKVRFK